MLEEIIVENFPKMGKEIATQVQNPESPKQDKPKAKHPKAHINQVKKIKHKEQILKTAREKQQITHKGIPIRNAKWILKRSLEVFAMLVKANI